MSQQFEMIEFVDLNSGEIKTQPQVLADWTNKHCNRQWVKYVPKSEEAPVAIQLTWDDKLIALIYSKCSNQDASNLVRAMEEFIAEAVEEKVNNTKGFWEPLLPF